MRFENPPRVRRVAALSSSQWTMTTGADAPRAKAELKGGRSWMMSESQAVQASCEVHEGYLCEAGKGNEWSTGDK